MQRRSKDVNLDIFSQVLGGSASNNLIERQEFLKLIGCSMETSLSVVVHIVFFDYDYHSRWLAMGKRF